MKLNKSTVAMRNVINPRQVVLEKFFLQLCDRGPQIFRRKGIRQIWNF